MMVQFMSYPLMLHYGSAHVCWLEFQSLSYRSKLMKWLSSTTLSQQMHDHHLYDIAFKLNNPLDGIVLK